MNKLIDHSSCLWLVGIRVVFVGCKIIVGDVLPLIEGIATLDHFFLKQLVTLLILPQLLLLLLSTNQSFIGLVFVLLPIDCFEVPLFGTPLLQVKLFLELNIGDICIHFDDIVPKYLFLVESLLDFSDGQI
jgi:hypothetical protein